MNSKFVQVNVKSQPLLPLGYGLYDGSKKEVRKFDYSIFE